MREMVGRRVPLGVKPKDRVAPLDPSVPVVRGDCVVRDAAIGEPVIVQASLASADTAKLRNLIHARRLPYNQVARMSGLEYEYATFGYSPRTPLHRQDACSASQLMIRHPATHAGIDAVTVLLEEQFASLAPAAFAEHMGSVARVLPDWRINRTSPRTSGVINNTAALAYHCDSNNMPKTWSAMLVLRQFVRGGHLHVPEYGVALECADNATIFFQGSKLLHGVTPFRKTPGYEGSAYRVTMVWYAINRMTACLPMAQELAWARRHRTEREGQAAEGVAGWRR